MKQLAALGGSESGFGRVPTACGKTRCGEGLEGALRLGSQDAGAALCFAGGKGDAAEILKWYGLRWRGRGSGELGRQGLVRPGELGHEARRARFRVRGLARKAEVDFGRGGQQAGGDGLGQIPIELRGGVGHSGFALDVGRKQGVHGAFGRPRVFVCTQKPDGVGGEAGGLGGTGDLDGSVAGLGREEGFVEGAVELGNELRPGHAAAVETQGAADFQCLLPAVDGLELRA